MWSLNADASPSYLDLFYLQNRGNKLTNLWETALFVLHWLKHDFAFVLLSEWNDLDVTVVLFNKCPFWMDPVLVCLSLVCFHSKRRQRLQVAPWSAQSPQLRISGPMVFGRRRKVLSEFIDLATKATRLLVSPAHPLAWTVPAVCSVHFFSSICKHRSLV